MDDFRLSIDDLDNIISTDPLVIVSDEFDDPVSTDPLDHSVIRNSLTETIELGLTNEPVSTETGANSRKRKHLTETDVLELIRKNATCKCECQAKRAKMRQDVQESDLRNILDENRRLYVKIDRIQEEVEGNREEIKRLKLESQKHNEEILANMQQIAGLEKTVKELFVNLDTSTTENRSIRLKLEELRETVREAADMSELSVE